MVLYPRNTKLVDCFEHGSGSQSELIIVEGDSAAAAVQRVCNGKNQAVLAIQGKPLNAMKASESAIRQNAFLKAIIESIGSEFGGNFESEKCRYRQIVLLCDPDADGIHCATLLLLFFYRCMKPLIETDRIRMIRPPMMQLIGDGLQEPILAYSEEEGQAIVHRFATKYQRKLSKQRFRGLASFPPKVLEAYCVDRSTRQEEKVTVADVESCIRMLQDGV